MGCGQCAANELPAYCHIAGSFPARMRIKAQLGNETPLRLTMAILLLAAYHIDIGPPVIGGVVTEAAHANGSATAIQKLQNCVIL